jgi:hypothetical protein
MAAAFVLNAAEELEVADLMAVMADEIAGIPC